MDSWWNAAPPLAMAALHSSKAAWTSLLVGAGSFPPGWVNAPRAATDWVSVGRVDRDESTIICVNRDYDLLGKGAGIEQPYDRPDRGPGVPLPVPGCAWPLAVGA